MNTERRASAGAAAGAGHVVRCAGRSVGLQALVAMLLVGAVHAGAIGQQQNEQDPRRPGTQPGDPSPTPPLPGDDIRARELREQALNRASEAEERERAQEILDMERMENALQGRVEPIAPQNGNEDFVGSLVGQDGMVSLDFGADPVSLVAFVDYVSKALGVNIFVDPQITGKELLFQAPLKIPAKELLPLLTALLDQQGFVLSRDPLGFYTIKQGADIPVLLSGEIITTKLIPTPMLKPSALKTMLSNVLGSGGGATPGGTMRFTEVDELGVLIVTASPKTLATVEQVLDEIFREWDAQNLRRFEVRHVSADFAINRVLLLNGQLARGITQLPGAQVGGVAQGVIGGALGNLESRLFVGEGNAVIFRGTEEEAAKVAELIAMVDIVTPLVARRYVAGSVATDVVTAGERLGLGYVEYAGGASTTLGGMQPGRAGSTGFARGSSGFGTDSGAGLSGSGFTLDEETGSFIYYGTESQHQIVDALVRQFKEQSLGDAIEIQAYKLKYAKAEGDDGGPGLVDLLNELIEDPTQRTARGPLLPGQGTRTADGGGGEAELADLEAAAAAAGDGDGTRLLATRENTIIVADEARNQIIIKAPARVQKQFAELIAKLDQKQPQVMVEARIVALRWTDTFRLAADVQLNAGQWSFLSTFGLIDPGDTIDQPGAVPPGTAGVTTAVIKSDFVPFVIQALATVGEARVESNPRILVNDNFEANQESTREEPYQTTTQTAGNPVTTSQGGTATAGTKLTVKPTISAGGDISLEYQIELSDFDRASQQPGLSPPKQQELYKSKVTIPSDSTIVVGGFTLETTSDSVRKIPILGDLPIVGLLFRDTAKNNSRNTIFVFLTPKVMNDPTGLDLRLLSRGPIEEAGIPGDVPELEPAEIPIGRTPPPPRLLQDNALARGS